MAMKKSDDSKLIRTIPSKYALIDNADKTNKALAEKRKKETAARTKKDAKSQKAGLKAANKPVKVTPATVEATRLALKRAEAVREAAKQGKGPKMTAAERIAYNRGTILDLPKPPGKLKKASQAADRLLQQANEASARKAAAKKNKPKAPKTLKAKPKGRGGRGFGGMGGGGGLFGGRGLSGTR